MDKDSALYVRYYQEPIEVGIYPSEEALEEESEGYYPPEGGPNYGGFSDYHFTDKLPPNGKRVYYVYFEWPSTDETQRPEGISRTFTIKLNYGQPTN